MKQKYRYDFQWWTADKIKKITWTCLIIEMKEIYSSPKNKKKTQRASAPWIQKIVFKFSDRNKREKIRKEA